MIDNLPFDVIENVVKHLDIHSILKFRCSCKTSNNLATEEIFKTTLIRTVNQRLNDIIELIQKYHKMLNQTSVRKTVVHTLLNQLYLLFKQKPLEYLSFIEYMFRVVSENANCSRDDVVRVWFRYMNSFSIVNENQTIIDELESFVLSKRFSLLFVYTDCNNQGKYYIQLEINFDDEQHPLLGFTMQDIINDKHTNKEDMRNYLDVKDAEYDQDGFIRFEVSKSNILALSKFIVDVMGLDVFVFEPNMVSYINCHTRLCHCIEYDFQSFTEQQINKFVSREEYRDNIIDILYGIV